MAVSSFKNFINSLGLVGIGLKGMAYTWNNKRDSTQHIQE